MLQIKLNSTGGPSTEGGEGVKATSAGEATTVAYPNHLNIADLAVAKSLGSVTAAPVVKTVGRKARPQMGERVHICVRCDFPIAIYGRLSPCDHAFCLDCARSDPTCSICDERIQKIQTMRVHEGIWICAAPQCFKSFVKKDEFDTHVHGSHGDLIKKIDSEATSAKKPTSECIVANKDVDHMSGQNASKSRVVKGMLPPQPGSHPPHSTQLNRFRPSSGGASHDAK